ncbi:FMN-binding protein [Roseiconus nitratireducens]|uniref:FMN-binding protein n=1 Tax=Roseiconus nitratireducens TaxID=2605748 RepID=A0A5M6D2L4_9BACT|nr:FMN-binding protein [Roseiconus nitratireducens]KAA5541734.1 FMN-binding protein [Roseiconus nitratireducens]
MSSTSRPIPAFGYSRLVPFLVALLLGFAPGIGYSQDQVEFLNGTTIEGKVQSIRKTDREFDFETTVGDRTLKRTYPFAKVHAVILKGKRYELTPKQAGDSAASQTADRRSESEIKAVIEAAGETPPEWFESTDLDYPKSLDLSWPLRPPTKEWESHKNMGQYIWSVINENPGRWHSGIKLVHHVLSLHQDDPVLLRRDMESLGNLYFTLLQDYARAAFWFQKAKPDPGSRESIRLAECYWRLGNRPMALKLTRGRSLPLAAIKLLGEMGELDRAVRLAEAFGRTSQSNQALLLAGDALRQAGRAEEAITIYQRVVDNQDFRNKEYENRMKSRARDSIEAIRLFDQVDLATLADGKYTGNAIGYNGKLDVAVQVGGGKIRSVRVTSHSEKQFYAALTDTPNQIVQTQSLTEVDATSGATVTSQAIVNATAKAVAGTPVE